MQVSSAVYNGVDCSLGRPVRVCRECGRPRDNSHVSLCALCVDDSFYGRHALRPGVDGMFSVDGLFQYQRRFFGIPRKSEWDCSPGRHATPMG